MAHYFVYTEKIGSPFRKVSEMKMVIPSGVERRQASRHPKMLFILRGECGVRMVDGFSARLAPGDVLLVPKPCHHYYTSFSKGEDSELYVFALFLQQIAPPARRLAPYEAEWFRLLAPLFSGNRHLPGVIDFRIQAHISAFRDEHYEGRPGSLVRQRAICQELVVDLARSALAEGRGGQRAVQPRPHAFIASEVKEFLGKTVDRAHSLPEIAWRLGMSEEHLARVFKKETGTSVIAYLREIRVNTAKTMLLSSNQTISALAACLGFSSSNHFCRTFLQFTGQTPLEYRRTHAGMNDPSMAGVFKARRGRRGG